MKVLVIGGTGNTSTGIVRLLLERGDLDLGIDRKEQYECD